MTTPILSLMALPLLVEARSPHSSGARCRRIVRRIPWPAATPRRPTQSRRAHAAVAPWRPMPSSERTTATPSCGWVATALRPLAGHGREKREEREPREKPGEKGILDVFAGRTHMSGLSNSENQTECRRNGVEGKKFPTNGTCDRSNFVMICR